MKIIYSVKPIDHLTVIINTLKNLLIKFILCVNQSLVSIYFTCREFNLSLINWDIPCPLRGYVHSTTFINCIIVNGAAQIGHCYTKNKNILYLVLCNIFNSSITCAVTETLLIRDDLTWPWMCLRFIFLYIIFKTFITWLQASDSTNWSSLYNFKKTNFILLLNYLNDAIRLYIYNTFYTKEYITDRLCSKPLLTN